MRYRYDTNPLPHSADCSCHLCTQYGPGLHERDIWRNPDHPSQIVRKTGITTQQEAYRTALSQRMYALRETIPYGDCETEARRQLQAEGLEP